MKKLFTTLFITFSSIIGFASGHVATAVGTNVTCNGLCNGTANSFASGGIGPYGYSWTGPSGYTANTQNISGLCAGTYVVTATDSSDMSTALYTLIINEPAQLIISMPGTIQTCAGSCVALNPSVTGGTPGYTFNWNPPTYLSSSTVATPISCPPPGATTYMLTVTDANGCTANATVVVVVNSPPSISLTPNPTACGSCNGSISNSTTGAVTYSWAGPSGYSSTVTNPTNLCTGTYTLTAASSSGCVSSATTFVSASSSLVVSVSGTNASCFGTCDGSLTATPSGGTPPYTYNWSPSGNTVPAPTGLCPGTYTVVVTDAMGCSFPSSGIVNQPAPLSINLSSTPSSCSTCDGAISLNLAGGVAPFTFSWSGGLSPIQNPTNVCSGAYNVVVTDANGCSTTGSVTVTNIGAPALTYNVTPSACSPCNGTVNLIQSGGTSPYLYDLSNGSPQQSSNIFTGVCSGSYVATVTDSNGCLGFATLFVPNNGIPGLTVTQTVVNESAAGMNNGYIDLTLTGGSNPPFTFMWSNGATTEDIYSLTAGNYSVIITDANGNCITYNYNVTTIPSYGYITGFLYNDVNQNCVYDAGDSPLTNYYVTVTNGINTYSGITNASGYYSIWVPNGSYTVVPSSSLNLTSGCTTSYNVTVTSGSVSNNNNFSYTIPPVYDVCVSTWSPGVVPGFNGTYYIYLSNYSTLPVSGTICFNLPSILNYVSSTPAGATVSGSSICWNYTNITAYTTIYTVTFYTPTTVSLGTPTVAVVTATVSSGTDINPACNTYTYTRPVTGSFDPNDKTVSPAGVGATGDIQLSETEFNYLIRFQNTGNGPAVNIVVDDTISGLLDLQSLEVLNVSHDYVVQLLPNNLLRFRFDNIMLADSTSNEPASHGHIQFRINKLSTPIVGQVIENTAYIYFDFNEPVITNTAINTYVSPSSVFNESSENGNVKIYPNPFSETTTFVVNSTKTNEAYSFELFDVLGKKVMEQNNITAKQFSINRNNLENGMYFYKLFTAESIVGVGKVIVR